MNIYTLMEIKDHIYDMKTYHNFCLAVNIPFKTYKPDCISFNDCENITNYSTDFIKVFSQKLNWEIISEQKLTENFLNEFQTHIIWFYIFKNHKEYRLDFLKQHKNKINMQLISMCELSDNFIRTFFYDIFNDYTLEYYIFNNLSLNLLKEFELELDWDIISQYQIPNNNFLEQFKNNINWRILCKNNNLSENQIEKYQDYVDWNYISGKYIYSNEKFLNKFKHKLNWYRVSRYYVLNFSNIIKFKDLLVWSEVSQFQYLDKFLIYKYEDKIDWCRFSANELCLMQNLSDQDFVDKYKSKIKWKFVNTYNTRLSQEFILKNNLHI